MKLALPILINLIILGSVSSLAQTPDIASKQVVETLTEELNDSPLSVKVKNLVIENTKISSAFAENFLGLVVKQMQKNEEDYVQIELRKTTRGLTLNNDFEDNFKETNVFLKGSYREAGKRLFVSLKLLDSDGNRISEAEVPVSISSIKEEFKPPSLTEILEENKKQEELQKNTQDFLLNVELYPNHGLVLCEGDDFEVSVKPEIDSYIKLVFRNVSGKTETIYPDPSYPSDFNQKLAGKKSHRLPPPKNNNESRWKINCTQYKCGAEKLIVIASTEPFLKEPKTITRSWSLSENVKQQVERGISRDALRGMSSLSITTVKFCR